MTQRIIRFYSNEVIYYTKENIEIEWFSKPDFSEIRISKTQNHLTNENWGFGKICFYFLLSTKSLNLRFFCFFFAPESRESLWWSRNSNLINSILGSVHQRVFLNNLKKISNGMCPAIYKGSSTRVLKNENIFGH